MDACNAVADSLRSEAASTFGWTPAHTLFPQKGATGLFADHLAGIEILSMEQVLQVMCPSPRVRICRKRRVDGSASTELVKERLNLRVSQD